MRAILARWLRLEGAYYPPPTTESGAYGLWQTLPPHRMFGRSLGRRQVRAAWLGAESAPPPRDE